VLGGARHPFQIERNEMRNPHKRPGRIRRYLRANTVAGWALWRLVTGEINGRTFRAEHDRARKMARLT
jgi:hypothetical protein